MKSLTSRLYFLLVMWLAVSSSLNGDWTAAPGTVKVFGRKKPNHGQPNAARQVSADQLQRLGAEVVEESDAFFLLQLPIPNASASPRILSDIADTIEIRGDLDILQFKDLPIDARLPEPTYPGPWEKQASLPSPARDSFVIQFATSPQPLWLEQIKAAGATILDYVPQNGYVVLADRSRLQKAIAGLPVQQVRIQQPFHKASGPARNALGIAPLEVSIANVPEADEAVILLNQATVSRIRPPENQGDRTVYRALVDSSVAWQLATMPAVLWIDSYSSPTPSGEREVHLTIGDTLVSNVSGVLKPVIGDHRSWIGGKGVGNYKTAAKVAILDTGFDTGSSTDVHPDFKNSTGSSFVTVKPYTNHVGPDAD